MKRITLNPIEATAAIVVYIAAIVAANVLTNYFGMVPTGFGLPVTAGTFAAGFALLARDFVQRYAGTGWSLLAVVVGIGISWFLASPALALASAAAFGVAELIDLGLFTWIRPRGFIRAGLISNVIAAPIDTIVFLSIAGFPLTWESVLGQFIGKILWATVSPLLVYWLVTRAVLRKSVNAKSA